MELQVIDKIIDNATNICIKEREQYMIYFNVIRNFAKTNVFFKFDRTELDDITNYTLQYYTHNAIEKAKKLSIELYKINKKDKSRYVKMTQPVNELIADIYINERHICSITQIHILLPLKLISIGDIFNAEVRLISLLQDIYNPINYENWGKCLKEIEYLNSKFEYENDGSSSENVHFNKIKNVLKDCCVFANITPVKIQVITDLPVNDIQTKLSSIYPGLINYEQSLYLFLDIRMEKYIFSHDDNAFLEVFNSASYELIPYKLVDDIMIAHKYVMMRFKLLDLWTLYIHNSKLAADKIAFFRNKIITSYFRSMSEQYKEPELFYGQIYDFKTYVNRYMDKSIRPFIPLLFTKKT